ncbi:hypothetical protein PGT21_007861 [Puccinia graminis f. sp. tritici]|uniref:Uncharacterized protein n=1 Tax=Puccinia graminis f. sp. tritici TaxID=56615 RepID=A0A5B0MU60_PUCGR|nr:hypothetical protein PGT21_007861 [Puccinia graminis f. sp. tritici]
MTDDELDRHGDEGNPNDPCTGRVNYDRRDPGARQLTREQRPGNRRASSAGNHGMLCDDVLSDGVVPRVKDAREAHQEEKLGIP